MTSPSATTRRHRPPSGEPSARLRPARRRSPGNLQSAASGPGSPRRSRCLRSRRALTLHTRPVFATTSRIRRIGQHALILLIYPRRSRRIRRRTGYPVARSTRRSGARDWSAADFTGLVGGKTRRDEVTLRIKNEGLDFRGQVLGHLHAWAQSTHG
jgi:hypothetical protein